MALDPNNNLQKFRFDPGNNFHWLVMPHYGRYVAVHDSSQADGVPVILWQWAPTQENIRFRLEPAGGGYYRIKAVHSEKFFDVYLAKTTDDAGVVQHSLMTSENQLFKPVPVIDQAVGANATSYAEVNELIRTGALGLIGLIPDGGGALKFLVGLFWTEHNKLADLWDQMKSYVDVRVRELLKEAQLKQLREMLAGQLKVLNEIKNSPGLKGTKLEDVILKIVEKEPHFLEQSKEVLPYMVGLGTIMITLRHMMVANYRDLFGKDPDQETLDSNKAKLRSSIKEYSDAVNKSKVELLEWRMSHIKERNDDQQAGVGWTSTVRDTYDGWSMEWHIYENGNGDEDYKVRAQNAVQQRRNQIRTQYECELNEFLRAAKFWPYFDPGSATYRETVIKKEVGSFGGPYSHNPFTGVDGQPITKIIAHSNNASTLCGLEVFYDGRSSGLKGARGTNSSSIVLEEGEYITSVYGYLRNIIEGVWFITQKGNTVGAGNRAPHYARHLFCADIADSFNPKLAKISGSYNGDTIEHLTFHWEYID
ncbi:MAG: RICIN domain-containing protein [Dyadobacter fermentans]